MKRNSTITKKKFLLGFLVITLFLALIRVIVPSVAETRVILRNNNVKHKLVVATKSTDSVKIKYQSAPREVALSYFFNSDGSPKKNRILGVRDYDESFPDSQPQQLSAALKFGVKPVADRVDAERRKSELVYIGSNPYYNMKKLNNSVPYLVPRAAVLLQDIARNFMDSLQTKGVPLNKLLISSVLRTKEDVQRLRKYNKNATENSCHLYGTTFDIAYNKYAAITRPVRNDTLKWVLSEVLNDLRSQGRCYIKHEKHQGCFHITVR
ncbi:MAG: DUF5715 family protein [Prevotella histicola]|jgi:hypothetical protein|uniref:DUF5715 family protein n=1 Tax=Prevotella histicola TaxID=470565 RepID=UPI001CB2CF76|nr:DUF5715 family protein [Prevotella histicola]MBF1403409.1 hypothetical protein [Prevotella histicola]